MSLDQKKESIIWTLLKLIANPVVIITTLGPFVIVTCVNYLLVFLNNTDSTSDIAMNLSKTLEAPWTFAFGDYIIQLYTLVLAAVLFYIDYIKQVGVIIIKDFSIAKNSNVIALVTLLAILLLILSIIALTAGWMASPTIVSAYLPGNGKMWGQPRLPPFGSPITWGRIIIAGMGFALAMAAKEVNNKNKFSQKET